MGCALVDTPPTRFSLDQGQPPSSELIKGVVTHDALKPRPFVDDLGAQPGFIHVYAQRDSAPSVEYGVVDELADEQLASVKRVSLEPVRRKVVEQTTRVRCPVGTVRLDG